MNSNYNREIYYNNNISKNNNNNNNNNATTARYNLGSNRFHSIWHDTAQPRDTRTQKFLRPTSIHTAPNATRDVSNYCNSFLRKYYKNDSDDDLTQIKQQLHQQQHRNHHHHHHHHRQTHQAQQHDEQYAFPKELHMHVHQRRSPDIGNKTINLISPIKIHPPIHAGAGGEPMKPVRLKKLPHEQQPKSQRNQHQHQARHMHYSGLSSESTPRSPHNTAQLSDRSNVSTEQHYQHYYSYFYHDSPDIGDKPKVNRKLPLHVPNAAKMPDNRNIPNDNRPHSIQHHVLKEKMPNNNIVKEYDNGEWIGQYSETEIIRVTGDFLDVRDIYGNKMPYTDTKDNVSTTKPQACIRNDLELTQNSSGAFNLTMKSNIWQPEDIPATLNNNNTLQSPRPREAEPRRTARLPLTPKRNRGGGGTMPKKTLPSVHRVLLYNNQSPRLTRKSQTSVRIAELRGLRGRSPKKEIREPSVILIKSPLLHESKIVAKTPVENRQDIDDFSDNDLSSNDDYDEDDDLDNVSNFDESDASANTSDTEDGYRAYAYKLTHSMDRVSATQSILSSQSSEASLKNPDSLLVPSLFPHVPPYISFSSNKKKGPNVPPDLYRVLKWRVTNIMPKVVRHILANSGMRLLKKTNDWMGVWGKHLKSPCFKTIRPYQKINHLPGSFKIGRKDSCWKNLQKQMTKHSNREFGFMPRTYIIPHDLNILRKHWPKYAQRNVKWIIKPPASARGAGIRVINRWAQIPKRKPLIVQKYIERPLLINGSKFDLRLYVLVTSINPLRVFMYHNGLARFASVKYSSKPDTLNDRCMHLTNYSINKFSSNYSKNEDVNACHGHKWTIKSLWTYLANRGVRTDQLWEALRSLVLRTILAGENSINNMIKMNVESKYSCFELFGFDVLLDSDLIPWLLEVNISPSLHSELPLDAHVKAPLVQSVLNTALYNIPPKFTTEKQKELAAELSLPLGSLICYDKRLYINYLSREEKVKHNTYTRKAMDDRDEYIDDILRNLTPDDVRCLITAEDELARCEPLERIFPTDQTYKYLKYTDTPRYYNRLLDAWEARYSKNREEGITILRHYCEDKYHLQVPAPPAKKILKRRPRTLVVMRPTVLTPNTIPWAIKWKNRKHLSRSYVRFNPLPSTQQPSAASPPLTTTTTTTASAISHSMYINEYNGNNINNNNNANNSDEEFSTSSEDDSTSEDANGRNSDANADAAKTQQPYSHNE